MKEEAEHGQDLTLLQQIEGEPEEDSGGSDVESLSKVSSSSSHQQQRGPIAEMLYSRWLEVCYRTSDTIDTLG